MNNKINLKKFSLVFIVVVIACLTLYFWYNRGVKKEGFSNADQIPTVPKKYDVNEYSSIYISDQNMCTKYLSDYLLILSENIEEAYYLLDEEYRNKKFGSLENFVSYINQKSNTFSEISRYRVLDNIYYVYDKSNNLFIFKTKGVMQYSVYLDDYTVEI